MKKVIELQNVSIEINKQCILENINLDVYENEMVAIIGYSGVGKTTLFKALLKSFKNIQGIIKIFDQNIYKIAKKDWKMLLKNIGFLNQKPNLIETTNVYENIKNSWTNYKNNFYKFLALLTKEQKTQIFEVLSNLNLLNKSFNQINDLSGGEAQRVEIAKLLLKQPKIILADEPTSSLDYLTSREIIQEITKLKNKLNASIIINIHDLGLVKEYFDRVIILNNKKIVYDGKTNEIELCEMIKLIAK